MKDFLYGGMVATLLLVLVVMTALALVLLPGHPVGGFTILACSAFCFGGWLNYFIRN